MSVVPLLTVPVCNIPLSDAAIRTCEVVVASEVEDYRIAIFVKIYILDVAVSSILAEVLDKCGAFFTCDWKFYLFTGSIGPCFTPVF